MDLKIALLVGLVVGLIAAAFLFWPSPVPIPFPAAEIAVEDAIAQWPIELQGSSDLVLETSAVLPRILTDHAATSSLVSPLQQAPTEDTTPRVLVEHAATVSFVPIGTQDRPTPNVSPRILVQHVATVLPIGTLSSSSGLQSDSAKVSTKVLIENAEVVNIRLLEAVSPGSLGE